MATTKLPVLPADKKIADSSGQLTDPYWLFLDSLTRAIRNQDDGVTINGVPVTY